MKRQGYELGGQMFRSKAAVMAALRPALATGEVDRATTLLLTDLLERHPNADEKLGVGAKSFFVDRDGYGGKCFWIYRHDGTKTDFSVMHCLTPRSDVADVRAACRTAVREQIVAFKQAALERASVCDVTGQPVTWWNSHVDHAAPHSFRVLVTMWLDQTDADLSVDGFRDGETERRFTLPATAQEWATFHAQRAVLRLVHWRVNLSELRKQAG